MKIFLTTHNIKLNERPIRRHNKTGIVERNHRTVKSIQEQLQNDTLRSNDATLLSRATFLSIIFSVSKTLSSFELAKGYKPALLGVGSKVVTIELLDAYKDQIIVRSIH